MSDNDIHIQNSFSKMLWHLKKKLEIEENDENFKETPERWARMMDELFWPKSKIISSLKDIFSKSFPSDYAGIVNQGPISVWSMCPHHFVPVEYVVYVAYVSDPINSGRAVGLSKLARCAEIIGKTPILQEDYTQKLANTLSTELKAQGVGVFVKGRHMCMCARGAKQGSAWTTTSVVLGVFRTELACREEWYQSINLIEGK